MNNQQKIIQFFLNNGWSEVQSSAPGYREFIRSDLMESSNSWWIGNGRVYEGISFKKCRDITKIVILALEKCR